RRGAVDLVGEHDIREYRPRFPFKNAAVLVVNRQADDVGWQQVGSKLDTLKDAVERAGERMGQRRFTHAGNVFNQQMTTGDEGDDRQSNRLGLALDNGFDGRLEPFDLVDRVGAGNLSAADWLEVPHELA